MSEAGVEHRLTTILAADVVGYSRLMAADVVGYSRLMGEDEAGTLAHPKPIERS